LPIEKNVFVEFCAEFFFIARRSGRRATANADSRILFRKVFAYLFLTANLPTNTLRIQANWYEPKSTS